MVGVACHQKVGASWVLGSILAGGALAGSSVACQSGSGADLLVKLLAGCMHVIQIYNTHTRSELRWMSPQKPDIVSNQSQLDAPSLSNSKRRLVASSAIDQHDWPLRLVNMPAP